MTMSASESPVGFNAAIPFFQLHDLHAKSGPCDQLVISSEDRGGCAVAEGGSVAATKTRRIRRGTRDTSGRPVVAGIGISHPERLIYPELNLSKLQLAEYYERIGTWILPHVQGRPLTLVHCAEGLAGPCRFLRHAKAWGPSALRRVRIREKTKVGEYLVADSVPAVVSLAQMGIVEIHTWNSTVGDLERPNRIVWDLDPGPEVAWPAIVACARMMRDLLDTLGLEAWVKTTGGRGVHIVVPLVPSSDWSAVLAFSREVSEVVGRANPRLYTTKFSKKGRERKILIDYLRNNRTNTSISAYSPRARAGARVSMPVGWKDLDDGPERWTLLTAPRRLQRQRTDPWNGYGEERQRISARALQALRRI
jgi:bifunctional non-homologous end joining protein LigD